MRLPGFCATHTIRFLRILATDWQSIIIDISQSSVKSISCYYTSERRASTQQIDQTQFQLFPWPPFRLFLPFQLPPLLFSPSPLSVFLFYIVLGYFNSKLVSLRQRNSSSGPHPLQQFGFHWHCFLLCTPPHFFLWDNFMANDLFFV
jgi:hypothetical protein